MLLIMIVVPVQPHPQSRCAGDEVGSSLDGQQCDSLGKLF